MLTLAEIMTTDVVTVAPEMTLREVVEILREEEVSGAPVVVTGEVVGVISATDILDFEVSAPGVPTSRRDRPVEWGEWDLEADWNGGGAPAGAYFTEMWSDAGANVVERIDRVEGPEWDVLEEHTASEIMSRSLWALPPDTEVAEAAANMLKRDVHRVLVVEDHTLVGMVTATDIVRAVAERLL